MYLVVNLMSSIKGGHFLTCLVTIDLYSRRSVFLWSSCYLLCEVLVRVNGFSVIFSWLLCLGGRGVLERWMLVVIDVACESVDSDLLV
jgi:hypothetical protein